VAGWNTKSMDPILVWRRFFCISPDTTIKCVNNANCLSSLKFSLTSWCFIFWLAEQKIWFGNG
jgi:hypothetical protein